MMHHDVHVLRALARQIAEITSHDIQDPKRELWRRHHAFQSHRPLIYMRAYAFHEHFDQRTLQCHDPFYRHYEYRMHDMLFHHSLGDDYVLEPWLTVPSVYTAERWGISVALGEKPSHTGAAAYQPGLSCYSDIHHIQPVPHRIDEVATKRNYDKLQEAVGDIIVVDLDRGPQFRMWTGDISTDVAKLRGLEPIMWDIYDHPESFHQLLTIMRDGILAAHQQAEEQGDWSLSCHQNQAVPYAKELPDPQAKSYNQLRRNLWGYMAAQEYTTFSPMQFNEFMLEYQIPIIEQFGLSAYGCCEDLTRKIPLLRRINNLRRIAVSPFADVRACAEQIGTDYILSWRPNPATMISTGLDEDYVRQHMRDHFQIFRNNHNHFDITLKDVETVRNQPQNVKRWVTIVREEIESFFG